MRKVSLLVLSVLLFIGIASAQETNETQQLLNKIKQLESQIQALKAENLKLQAENIKLKNQLSEAQKWDARKLMDELFIYTVTPSGNQYKLLFHEGGLGGIIVYQYVGVWQGDAGKWRQYKQIAFFKPEKTKEGFMKPGIVLKPVWGFNGSKEVRIKSLAELIKWERKYNSIEGLAEYYKWMFSKYVEASTYAGMKLLFVGLIALFFGVVLGERKQPFGRLLNYITLRRVTGFKLTPEEAKPKRRLFLRRG